ncbi:50S ribosomal protein L25 [Syntrophomonas curvata]
MVNAEKINCSPRELGTRGYLKELKRRGFIPGTVYGKGMGNQAISLDLRHLTRIFQNHGSRGLFSLQIGGNGKALMAVVREIQRHPITGQLIHVDFWKVSMDEKINNTVGVYITGEEELIKKGGILQVGTKEIEVLCLPQDIPEGLTCDVGTLEIGDKITAADLTVPAGVEMLSEPDTLIVTVLAPSRAATGVEEGETAAEAGETAEAEGE